MTFADYLFRDCLVFRENSMKIIWFSAKERAFFHCQQNSTKLGTSSQKRYPLLGSHTKKNRSVFYGCVEYRQKVIANTFLVYLKP